MSSKRALALAPLQIAQVLVGLGPIAAAAYAAAALGLSIVGARKHALTLVQTLSRRLFAGRLHAR